MRARVAVLLLVLVLGLHFRALCQTTGAVNKILAIVNDDVVTETDLDTALGSSIEELKKEFSGDELKEKTEEVRKEFLNQMIEEKLILQEAKKYKIDVDDFEVEQRLKDVKSRFPSEDAFYAEIERSGVSTEVLKKRYKENIMMSKLVNQQVREKIVVTPTEIENYYKKHSEELKAPESAHLFGIVIRFEEGSTEEAVKQKADDVVKLARDGRDFGELAKVYSQGAKAQEGGDFGFVEKGQMREDFEKVIFALKPGEISDPVKTDTGYFIFKVEEKKEGYVLPLQEARPGIEDMIYREKAQKRYQDWIEKLKRDAFIQVK
ncbi:MAG: peptidylprolyl isomerase [Candidatus Omnitrophica bacterium]|nr:peptidylprolyl isomerase [Candidatus Omnitrophota bacterium]